MATIDAMKIAGLRDIQAGLKAADGESQKQIRVVFNNVAQAVVGGAQRRVPTLTGAMRKSIRATSGQREAKVSGGSSKVAYYGWRDFGGRVGIDKSVSLPYVKKGRYLYPAYDANKDSIEKALRKGLVDMCRNVGLEVDGG